jgi:DNA-binding response OmpR family regulator
MPEVKEIATVVVCEGDPDFVILDLSLPDMSGIDVLQEIREADGIDPRIDPHLPVIVMLNRGDGGARVRSLDLGADDYIQTPTSRQSRSVGLAKRCLGPASSL